MSAPGTPTSLSRARVALQKTRTERAAAAPHACAPHRSPSMTERAITCMRASYPLLRFPVPYLADALEPDQRAPDQRAHVQPPANHRRRGEYHAHVPTASFRWSSRRLLASVRGAAQERCSSPPIVVDEASKPPHTACLASPERARVGVFVSRQ